MVFLALSVLIFFFFFLLFFKFYFIFKLYNIVLVCQISKWIRHRYTCVPHPEPSSLLPPHTLPLGRPSAPAPSIILSFLHETHSLNISAFCSLIFTPLFFPLYAVFLKILIISNDFNYSPETGDAQESFSLRLFFICYFSIWNITLHHCPNAPLLSKHVNILNYSYPEKAMAPHSSTLAWKIPWTEEPGRLQSVGSLRVGHDWSDLAAAAYLLPIFLFFTYGGGGLVSKSCLPLVTLWIVACQAPLFIFLTRILEWVAIFFSRRSSQCRDWTWVFCLAGQFFTDWATREIFSSHMAPLHFPALVKLSSISNFTCEWLKVSLCLTGEFPRIFFFFFLLHRI